MERLILDNNDILGITGVLIELGAKGAVGLNTALGVVLDSEQMNIYRYR